MKAAELATQVIERSREKVPEQPKPVRKEEWTVVHENDRQHRRCVVCGHRGFVFHYQAGFTNEELVYCGPCGMTRGYR